MAEGGSVQGYLDAETRSRFDHIKGYYQERDQNIQLSDSGVIRKMVNDVYEKIVGGQTNSNRITTIVEGLADNTEELAANTHTLAEVTTELAELKEQIKQLIERSPK